MHARTTAQAAMMLLLAALLPAACTGGTAPTAGSSAPPASVAPTEAPTASPTPPAAAATPTASPAWVAAATDVVYESADPRLPDAMLDVYAPTGTGPWPVAVMLHGGPGVLDKGFMGIWAQKAAAEGFVVFVPTWGSAAPARSACRDPSSSTRSSARRPAPWRSPTPAPPTTAGTRPPW